jgi:hypothetical protein
VQGLDVAMAGKGGTAQRRGNAGLGGGKGHRSGEGGSVETAKV